MQLSYVLPLRATSPQVDLAPYLKVLSARVEVVVVDGSPSEVFEAHRRLFGPSVRHLPVDPRYDAPMGKVAGVMTGVVAASYDHVVMADDDVEYTADQLQRIDRLLDDHDVVRPQNWFDPSPWHARWDTGRILLNRVFGGDWSGTLGVRRSTLLGAGGYAGDVMFENLELVRTVEAAGGTCAVSLDLLVRRRPRYRGSVLPRAATPKRRLRRRVATAMQGTEMVAQDQPDPAPLVMPKGPVGQRKQSTIS